MTDADATKNTIDDAAFEQDAAYEQSLADVRSELDKAQSTYKKMRGNRALGMIVATSFKAGKKFLKSEPSVQALILSQHQINMTGNVNRFSPWIAASCGEEKPGADKVKAIDGNEYPKWVPDANMKRYFHTMEALDEAGFDETSDVKMMTDWIMAQGGSQSIVIKRLAAAKADEKPEREKREEEQRKLYLRDGPQASISLDTNAIKLPEGTAAYFTLVIEKGSDGSFIVRGVAEKDASAKLKKLAEVAYDDLKLRSELKAELKAEQEAEKGEKINNIASGEVTLTPEIKANARAALVAKQSVEAN
ncbi:hypothetical protein [Sphingobium sp. LSP13-1-1.1]|uniref:hypothetical protein n=1 Tax=Sphingobium sp. LSP13-1-1.1 TaxID=3135234 RepID=UPI00343C5BA4